MRKLSIALSIMGAFFTFAAHAEGQSANRAYGQGGTGADSYYSAAKHREYGSVAAQVQDAKRGMLTNTNGNFTVIGTNVTNNIAIDGDGNSANIHDNNMNGDNSGDIDVDGTIELHSK